MIRNISAIIAVALVTATMNVGGAFALDDRKAVSGAECVPKNLSQAGDFKYGGGGIINRSLNKRRVTCAILRDRYDDVNATGELDNVAVFVNRSSKATTDLTCTFVVRNLDTGAVLVSSSAFTSAVGPATLNVATDLDYGTPPGTAKTGNDNAIYELTCTLPEKSRIKGIRYEEDSNTDQERE